MPKGKKGMRPVQIFLPPDLLEEAKKRAQELGISLSEYFRQILITAVRFGFLIPGEEAPRIEARLSEEDLEEIAKRVLEALEERAKERKSIWRKILEWFR